MTTWNHDHGYHSENKMGNTHTALGFYMLESAFGLRAVPGWKLAPGLVPVAVGDRMIKLWCWGDEDGSWPFSCWR